MTQTFEEWKEEQIFKTNWGGYREELLKKYILCGGKPVILTATFNIRSREKNQLIFKSIKPHIETEVTPKRIFGGINFPADSLWKVRLLLTACEREQFYLIGRIKIIYENGRPKGTLELAEDIVPCPIMTESQFLEYYYRFRDQCYLWHRPEETSLEIPAKVKRRKNKTLLMRGLRRKQLYFIQVIKRDNRLHRTVVNGNKRKETNSEKQGDILQKSKKVAEAKPAYEGNAIKTIKINQKGEMKKDTHILDENTFLKGKLLDESVKAASEGDVVTNDLNNDEQNDYSMVVSSQWEQEFNTKKKKITFYGCECELINEIIYISNTEEHWQIHYSPVQKRLLLYHKNSKKDCSKNAVVKGYHEQYVPSIKEKPTIKEFIIYASLHKMKIEKDKEKPKRKRK